MQRILWCFICIMLIVTGCGSNRPTPSAIVSSPQPCIIKVNHQSIHDTINVFSTPRTDIMNPIGGLSLSVNCGDDDCPPSSIAVQGVLNTPDAVCETDARTCGTWYQVDWVRQGKVVVVGWISERDEDVLLDGDCDSVPTIDSSLYFNN